MVIKVKLPYILFNFYHFWMINLNGGADIRSEGADIRNGGSDIRSEGFDSRNEGVNIRNEAANRRNEGNDSRNGESDNRNEGVNIPSLFLIDFTLFFGLDYFEDGVLVEGRGLMFSET